MGTDFQLLSFCVLCVEANITTSLNMLAYITMLCVHPSFYVPLFPSNFWRCGWIFLVMGLVMYCLVYQLLLIYFCYLSWRITIFQSGRSLSKSSGGGKKSTPSSPVSSPDMQSLRTARWVIHVAAVILILLCFVFILFCDQCIVPLPQKLSFMF
jgi:hypothetical protein